MDRVTPTDLRILEILQREGDISNAQLAEMVALSPSACLQRVRKLRTQGLIAGVAVVLHLGRIANHVVVHCRMRLSEQTTKHYATFESAIQKIPEVVECSAISGEYDYLLKIVVRDMQHFSELLAMMSEMNIGIKNHSSMVEVKNVKRSFEMPLRVLLASAAE
jgi:Lrp/AsnC family leucine-responsive transcriptional regulator